MFDGCLVSPCHDLSYLSLVGNFKGYGNSTLHKPRLKLICAVPPVSVLVPTEEGGKSSEQKKGESALIRSSSLSPMLSHSNAVGIIGVSSVDATLNFTKTLLQCSSQDGPNNIPFVLCSDPVLSRELLLHERSSWPSITRQNERQKLDHTPIVEKLRSKRIFLEKSGSRCIVMPCHISHSWYDEIFKDCSAKVLHMGECVASELKEAKMKPLEAGTPLRIGVLASNVTLNSGYYQDKLQKEGFEVVLPDKATMEHTIAPAIEALSKKDMEGAQNLLRIALQVLLVKAVNTVIIGCDDMHNLLPQDDPLLKKCVYPVDALARATIKWAIAAAKDC